MKLLILSDEFSSYYHDDSKFKFQKEALFKLLNELKSLCVKQLKHHSYNVKVYKKEASNLYNLDWQRIIQLLEMIEKTSWSEYADALSSYKAQAYYYVGIVCNERGDYDESYCFLQQAKELIEQHSVQYFLPENYIRICIGLAKCYTEKHSKLSLITDCYYNAQGILNFFSQQHDTEETSLNNQNINSQETASFGLSSGENILTTKVYNSVSKEQEEHFNVRFQKVYLEFALQQAISALDMYGQRRQLDYDQIWKYLKTAHNCLQVLSKKNQDHGDEILYRDWKHKQLLTFLTTEGEYFKKLYFELSKIAASNESIFPKPEKDQLVTHVETSVTEFFDTYICMKGCRNPKFFYFYKELGSKTDKSDIKELDLDILIDCCFEISFYLYSQTIKLDSNNTICLDNIAALLYEYQNRYSDKNKFLNKLVLNYLPKKYMVCPEDRTLSIADYINIFLKEALKIEPTNMFALNLMASLFDHTSAGNRTINNTANHYNVLRQSSLKKRFQYLKNVFNNKMTGQLIEMEVQLVLLHKSVSKFMNSVIIDFSKPEWKSLTVGHYTTLRVLPKLINKEGTSRFRIQNVHHLNDPLEGAVFIEHIRNTLTASENDLVNSLLEYYADEKNGTVRNSVYMGSFTSQLDQLNMWSQYGDGGKGCSMQIDAARSFDSQADISLAEASPNEAFYSYKMDDTKYPLYMVTYLPEKPNTRLDILAEYAESRVRTSKKSLDKADANWWKKQAQLIRELMVFQEELAGILKEMNEILKNIGQEATVKTYRNIKSELCNIIMVILDLVRFLIKSDHYRDEREYRIIQHASNPEYDITDNDFPKLYVSLERELFYKKICFGPLIHNFDSLAAYVLNIKKEASAGGQKETWNLEVEQSKISYR